MVLFFIKNVFSLLYFNKLLNYVFSPSDLSGEKNHV